MKQFKPTSWSIDNKTSVYILTLIIVLFGMNSYVSLQKENFPDITIPTMMVQTVYAGTSPSDIENLVTRPIEKQCKGLSGVKKITSNSIQDFSLISVEFNTNVQIPDAKQKVKDAVDKAAKDLPTDLTVTPTVLEINFSDQPIMFVNLSGDLELSKMKKYADDMKDKIEGLPEITRVDVVGTLDQEVKVDVDLAKAQSAKISFYNIIQAIQSENLTVSGGGVTIGDMKRAVRVKGQFKDASEIGNIIVNSPLGAPVRLSEIAKVEDGYKERESYARLDGKPVITLNVVKRSGQNLIDASDKIQALVKEAENTIFPPSLEVTITGDQSNDTRVTLNDLINTIVIGFILVTLILMFFMGTVNALFVALSVPLSSFLAFMILPSIGFTMNMIVLFSFLLALGIVVDDAIVVIENTHRILHQRRDLRVWDAAKIAAGEVFVPVFAGTLTTVAPFIPLAFWPGIIGKFMVYLPVTLIIVLLASLFIAFIINPVFAVAFMKRGDGSERPINAKPKNKYRSLFIWVGLFISLGIITHSGGNAALANFFLFLGVFLLINRFVFQRLIDIFQNRTLPRLMNAYERMLRWILRGTRAGWIVLSVLIGVFAIFIIAGGALKTPTFFPQGDPKFVYVYLEMPIGTDLAITDSVTKILEKRVDKVMGTDNPDVESIIANVAIGAGDPMDPSSNQVSSNKGKITVAFKEFSERQGKPTGEYMNAIREETRGIPGATIIVDRESGGPPTGKPVNIEVSGEDMDKLVVLSKQLERYIDSVNVPGVEDLRSDLQDRNPELTIEVDRVRANNEGISTGQIANEIRTAIFGAEASKFKKDEEEYPIQVRYSDYYRKNMDRLMETKITFQDMARGGAVRQLPLSALATVKYGNTFGGIKRKNLKRVITLGSNVLQGYNENEVAMAVGEAVESFQSKIPAGFEAKLTGAQEDQAETSAFLGGAGLLALFLIIGILVTQFASISKPIIILTEVFFSIAGVLLGFAIFGMQISIVMTGVGIVALAGIVVKNGILLVEFADELRRGGMKTRDAIAAAGRARINPVLLTATATILGLVPLAIGMNINFLTLLESGDPDFYIGGESSAFWGPLAWTIIFGLGFATLITLIVVPAMYKVNHKLRLYLMRKRVMSRFHKL